MEITFISREEFNDFERELAQALTKIGVWDCAYPAELLLAQFGIYEEGCGPPYVQMFGRGTRKPEGELPDISD